MRDPTVNSGLHVTAHNTQTLEVKRLGSQVASFEVRKGYSTLPPSGSAPPVRTQGASGAEAEGQVHRAVLAQSLRQREALPSKRASSSGFTSLALYLVIRSGR